MPFGRDRIRRRASRRQTPRLKGVSLNKLIPNLMTILALCAGLTAIRHGMAGEFQQAVVFVLAAAVLDGLDGRLARLLNGTSKFGAELDSLSDFVAFGVTPAMLLYLWVMKDAGSLGWVVVLFYAVCASLRLARFNTMLGTDMPAYAYNYFTGIPAPAAGALALLPMVLTFEAGPGVVDYTWLVGGWTLFVAGMMISTVPTFSGKGVKIPQDYVPFLLVGGALLAALLVANAWLTFVAIGIIYLASIPFAVQTFRRLRAEAEHLQAVQGEAAAPVPDAAPPAP